MSKTKDKEDHIPIRVAAPKSEPKPEPVVAAVEVSTICVICGQRGNLIGDAGAAKWHAACGEARPDLVAKAKARA